MVQVIEGDGFQLLSDEEAHGTTSGASATNPSATDRLMLFSVAQG